MEIYPYTIKLIDPLFYSQEALSGAFTPRYLHATAINHAAAWSMGRAREEQSYVISEATGGRNKPRYEHSWIEPDFYFTPASLKGDAEYLVETVKGDLEYFIQPGYGQAKIMGKSVGRNEVLKAYRIFSFPSETEFKGYLHAEPETALRLSRCIRLGSFRGKAELEIGKLVKMYGTANRQYVSHPVDPLVSQVRRGILISMFPYPIVDNALAENVFEIRQEGRKEYIAIPARHVSYDKDELLKRLEDLKPGLAKVKDVTLSLKDRAYLILHMLRTAFSVKHFLMGIPGEERLDTALQEIEEIENIRLASKGEKVSFEQATLLGLVEKIRGIIDDCERKIKGTPASKKAENSGGGSPDIIL